MLTKLFYSDDLVLMMEKVDGLKKRYDNGRMF